jgi:hypothetical protein
MENKIKVGDWVWWCGTAYEVLEVNKKANLIVLNTKTAMFNPLTLDNNSVIPLNDFDQFTAKLGAAETLEMPKARIYDNQQ